MNTNPKKMRPETFEWRGKKIYKRKSCYSDEMMVSDMSLIAGVVNATVKKTVGRGRNQRTVETLKHPRTDEWRIKIINDSLEYYTEKMNSKLKFRDYQEEIIAKGKTILTSKKFLYLAMEVRTGKTLTSLGIAEELGFENVLFITKKKAISSITADTNLLCPSYVFFVINYESLHKVPDVKWDLIICDEAHSLGSYPKPSKRAKAVKELIKKNGSSVIL